ncbi:putative membrane protein [Acorus calamus]|uniref:Membrane protein n=1 Tax=Acorus calamus TaxID=4465 RepID=A0AAV9CRN4_ACOCL|nr:putative membrane protein [Acorus calamus]
MTHWKSTIHKVPSCRPSSPFPLPLRPSNKSPIPTPNQAKTPSSHPSRTVSDIVRLFRTVSDPRAKYEQLLHYAHTLPPMDPSLKTESNRVRGCNHRSHCSNHNPRRQLCGDNWSLACSFCLDLLLHSKDGCVSTMKGSCTVVRDFTDFCFHSYFSLMDDLREKVSEDEKPIDLKLSRLPSCFVIGTLAVLLDVPIITALALGKSPYMLFKGWQRLLEDLIGREGPFLETVCVPFAGLAIILWPLAVVAAVISAFFCSFFLSLYSVIIVYQEKSLKMGLAYMVSVVSLFDEYVNDQLYLREGTCLPRRRQQYDLDSSTILSSNEAKLASKRSKTLKKAIRQLKPVQIWDWLFRSCELSGKFLLREGLIEVSDIQECLLKGKCKKLSIRLPAWCVLQCLLRSAKSDADGLLISDEVELTNFNWPKDKVLEWFLGPLLIMKEQIKGLQLSDNEEACLGKLIMTHNSQRPEDWNDSGFPSDDNVRRAQLQAIIRRLQGIVASMSRMPTFRRRFNILVKALYVEAIEIGAIVENGGSSRSKGKINMSVHNANENNITDEFEMV